MVATFDKKEKLEVAKCILSKVFLRRFHFFSFSLLSSFSHSQFSRQLTNDYGSKGTTVGNQYIVDTDSLVSVSMYTYTHLEGSIKILTLVLLPLCCFFS